MKALEELTDEQLVELFLDSGRRDEAAFAELFRRRRADVWRLCRGFFGNDRDAEDLTQEIFFTAYRKLRQFKGRSSLRTWLYRVASNTCKNELRRRSRRTEGTETGLDAALGALVTAESPEDRIVRERARSRLARAFAELGQEERRLLELVEFENRPYAAIARELGVSLGAVKMRVLRARLSLQEAYRRQELKGAAS